MSEQDEVKPVRHLLGLSGGKDSSALAIYIRDKYPEIHEKMEYFFADTGAELAETLEFIDLLEDYLQKPIVRLNADKDFDYYLKLHRNYLPSPKQRWCTINLKLIPFENFVGSDEVVSYVALRADEPDRVGYISNKSNIKTRMPFREDGLAKDDIFSILESSGIGIPKYYDWRSRSGCYFCFFQRKEEWVGLKRHHPDLFEKAKTYEKVDELSGKKYTWSQAGTLDEIVLNAENGITKAAPKKSKKLINNLEDENDDDDGCLICIL
jgi:3'-phosphoadenosine 5'-phosphosulfate sulfotransferase (PAPS reductase)/FAD synthetase